MDGGVSEGDTPRGNGPAPERPAHVEESVRTLADLHDEHYERLPPLGRALDTVTANAGRPGFVVALAALTAGWIAFNLAMKATGHPPLDPPPFTYLQSVATLFALVMTCLILSTQRREDLLSTRREQLTLELSLLAEQKASKAIQLLEELRRDSPVIADRRDDVAENLSTPSDARMILEAINETQPGENKPATGG